MHKHLFVICIPVSRLQWNPIAPSKRKYICSKIKDIIIITLMIDLGLFIQKEGGRECGLLLLCVNNLGDYLSPITVNSAPVAKLSPFWLLSAVKRT